MEEIENEHEKWNKIDRLKVKQKKKKKKRKLTEETTHLGKWINNGFRE